VKVHCQRNDRGLMVTNPMKVRRQCNGKPLVLWNKTVRSLSYPARSSGNYHLEPFYPKLTTFLTDGEQQ